MFNDQCSMKIVTLHLNNKNGNAHMRYLQWGFIGCGDVTERKSGPAFSEVAGSRRPLLALP